MSILTRIDDDLKAAMKASDAETLSVLRLARTALKNKQIELGKELDESEVIAVLKRESKQRKEAAAEFEKGNRPELAAKEQRETEILAQYLPEEMGDTELSAIVDEAIATTGATSAADMGKAMGAAIAKVAGRADGGRVLAMVKQRLAA